MIERVSPLSSFPASAPSSAPARAGDFDAVLRKENLRFSQHAMDRMRRDHVVLSPEALNKIQDGMDKAAGKGAKESLLLLDDMAFIANVREKIVITSMTKDRLKENIFTKIDSAVIL